MYEDIELKDIDEKIVANEGLIWKTLYKYYPKMVYDEDIFYFGMTGLWKALLSFDPDKGFEFSTYATRCIGNAVHAEVLRRMRREKPMASLEGVIEKTGVTDDKSIFLSGDKDVLWYDRRSLMEHLTPRQRTILELREQGYSCRECGEEVGLKHARAHQELKNIRNVALRYIG